MHINTTSYSRVVVCIQARMHTIYCGSVSLASIHRIPTLLRLGLVESQPSIISEEKAGSKACLYFPRTPVPNLKLCQICVGCRSYSP